MAHFSWNVVRKKQSKENKRGYRKFNVVDKFIGQNRQELLVKQESDVKLTILGEG